MDASRGFTRLGSAVARLHQPAASILRRQDAAATLRSERPRYGSLGRSPPQADGGLGALPENRTRPNRAALTDALARPVGASSTRVIHTLGLRSVRRCAATSLCPRLT